MVEEVSAFIKSTLKFPENYGKYTHLCVKRFLADMEEIESNPESKYIFREDRAERVIKFIQKLKQTKGDFNGKSFALMPFQQFLLACIFGFHHRADPSKRRYNRAYISLARKNGKSTLLSGIALYMLFADGEPSANGFTAASSREQAENVFRQCVDTISATKGLSKHLLVRTNNIYHPSSMSFLRKASSEAGTTHGTNPSFAVVDELHSMPNGNLWTAYSSGMLTRKNPLLFGITTCGTSKDGFGFQEEGYAKEILEGTAVDEGYFACIFSIDESDDPADERCWIKANPAIDTFISRDALKQLLAKGRYSPSALGEFIAYNLNRYTSTQRGWLNEDVITKCAKSYTPEELEGLECYGALDLSQSHDFTVYSLTFPSLNHYTVWKYFLPQETFLGRCEFENANYATWHQDGLITLTPTAVIDHGFVFESIRADAERYKLKELAYDRWKAKEIVGKLESEGINCVEFGQGMSYMAPAISQLTRGFMSGEIEIQDNPVSLWCLSNVEVRPDANGNMKFLKGVNQKKRIDGAIVHAMSYFRSWLATQAEVNKKEEKPRLATITWV
jgi:phage terminase large subunit-like protein